MVATKQSIKSNYLARSPACSILKHLKINDSTGIILKQLQLYAVKDIPPRLIKLQSIPARIREYLVECQQECTGYGKWSE